MVILSVRFLWRACTLAIQSSTWQVEVTSGSTSSHHVSQYYVIQSMHSLSMCPMPIMGGVRKQCDTFHEDVVLKFFIKSPAAIYISAVMKQLLCNL